jgi:hypothetical protein
MFKHFPESRVSYLFGPMKDRLRGHFPDDNAVITAGRQWVASADNRFLQAQHADSCSSVAKMHGQWW